MFPGGDDDLDMEEEEEDKADYTGGDDGLEQ